MAVTDPALLGTDLRVVVGPPGMAAYDAGALDLRTRTTPRQHVTPRPTFGAAAEPDEPQGWLPEPPGAATLTDLDTLSGRENVAQALILRLLTPKGALAGLGHAEYGSRLGELIGKNKTEALRGVCRAHILEAIRQEPRVGNAPLSINFDPASESASDFRVEIVVRPVDGGDPVALGLEVAL